MGKPGYDRVELPGGSTDLWTATRDLLLCITVEMLQPAQAEKYTAALRRAEEALIELRRFW